MAVGPEGVADLPVEHGLADLGVPGAGGLALGLGVDEAVAALHLPGGGSGDAGQILVEGIAPEVFVGGADEELPGGHRRRQEVGIQRKAVLVPGVGAEGVVEPVAVIAGDVLDGLPDLAPQEAGPAGAGADGDHVGEALVEGPRHHGGLPEAGAAHAAHPACVVFARGQEQVLHVAHAAAPDEELSGVGPAVALRPQDLTDPIVEAPGVRRDVARGEGRHGDAVLHEALGGQGGEDPVQGHADGDEEGGLFHVQRLHQLEGEGEDPAGIDELQLDELDPGVGLSVHGPAGIVAHPGFFPDRQGLRGQEAVGVLLQIVKQLSPALGPALPGDLRPVGMLHQLGKGEVFQFLFHRAPP